MGNAANAQLKQDIHSICNIIPDNPDHSILVWQTQEMKERLPPVLDRRYDLDISPMLDGIDFRMNGSITVAALLYSMFRLTHNREYMPSITSLHYLTMKRFYGIMDSPDPNFPYRVPMVALLETLKTLCVPSEKEVSSFAQTVSVVETTAPGFFDLKYFYVSKDRQEMKTTLYQNQIILCNLALFSGVLEDNGSGTLNIPGVDDKCFGMVCCLVVGYTQEGWVLRLPFGHHWGDGGYGYVTYEYFERFNRDRWVVILENVKEIPSRKSHKKKKALALVVAEAEEKKEEEEVPDLSEVDLYRWRLII